MVTALPGRAPRESTRGLRPLCRDDPIAPRALGAVEGLVRGLDEFGDRLVRAILDGDTDRDADTWDRVLAQVERADRPPHALADLDSDLPGRVAEQDRELLTAVPGWDVIVANCRGYRGCDSLDDLVPDGMPAAVIEALEQIYV
jgi:hypothetical protein